MIKMPNATTGRWSVGFGIAFVALMALSLFFAFIIGGDATHIAAVIAANAFLTILNTALNLTLNLAGLLSLLLGIFTIIKYKEWSICKHLVLLYGFAVLLFVLWLFLLRIERQWRIWSWYKSKSEGFIALTFWVFLFGFNFLLAFLRESRLYFYWLEIILNLLGTSDLTVWGITTSCIFWVMVA